MPEEDVGHDSSEAIEAGIIAEFEHVLGFPVPFLSLVPGVNHLINPVLHEVVVAVFRYLNQPKLTKMKKNPAANHIRESTAKT